MSNPDIRLAFIGDSFVNGACDPACLGWTGRVCASAMRAGHQITFYNLGIRRNTSADIAARWRHECELRLTGDFDGRVVFAFGVNDTIIENGKPRVEREASLNNARHILGEAQKHYPCLWVGPPPIAAESTNEKIRELCREFQVLASELEIPYLPVFEALLQSQAWMYEVTSGDGAHPQSGGYDMLARLVQNWDSWWFHSG